MQTPCPTFTRVAKRLWNSPTFTTWGKQGVQALRLLAVTPLILVHFNTTEIAAWYLFGSLTFFGTLISGRVGQTFSRMIAFAMGGATDLSPIKGSFERRTNADHPNWPLIERAYATTGALNALLTIAIAGTALAMGWYGLENLLADYAEPGTIWAALGVMILSQAVVFFFQRYSIALKGMNYVALSNRWDVVFSLLSIIAGAGVLQAGADILQVAMTMQGVAMLSIARNWFLVRYVEEGRFKQFRSFKLDRQMLRWAWGPAWKGMLLQLSSHGVIAGGSVLIARALPAEQAAPALLTISLIHRIRGVADAPFISHSPLISRLLSQKDYFGLDKLVSARINQSQSLFGIFMAGLILGVSPVFSLIGTNVNILEANELSIIALVALFQNQNFLYLQVCAAGNDIICVKRSVLSMIVSLVGISYLSQHGYVAYAVAFIFLPRVLIFNVVPLWKASEHLGTSPFRVLRKTLLANVIYILFFFMVFVLT